MYPTFSCWELSQPQCEVCKQTDGHNFPVTISIWFEEKLKKIGNENLLGATTL